MNVQVKVGPETDQIMPYLIHNKGTGAGGANTNYHGKKFEEQTNNELRLLAQGYTKQSISSNPKKTSEWYLSKTFDDKTITFIQQSGLKQFVLIKTACKGHSKRAKWKHPLKFTID